MAGKYPSRRRMLALMDDSELRGEHSILPEVRRAMLAFSSNQIDDSSVEFMGEFRFRELAKCVIEREFGDAKSSEAIGFSHGDFGFVVQTLDHAAGELLFSLEVIEN